jgi:hypothetical protein
VQYGEWYNTTLHPVDSSVPPFALYAVADADLGLYGVTNSNQKDVPLPEGSENQEVWLPVTVAGLKAGSDYGFLSEKELLFIEVQIHGERQDNWVLAEITPGLLC